MSSVSDVTFIYTLIRTGKYENTEFADSFSSDFFFQNERPYFQICVKCSTTRQPLVL